MRLILVRHAEAVDVGTGEVKTDAERHLTPRGERTAAKLGEALKRLGVRADAVLCSPLVRARQTAEPLLSLLAGDSSAPKICDALAPDSHQPQKVCDAVNQTDGHTVIAVGHLPDIAVLTSLLLGAGGKWIAFDKGTIACVRCHPRAAYGKGMLEWLVPPDWYGG